MQFAASVACSLTMQLMLTRSSSSEAYSNQLDVFGLRTEDDREDEDPQRLWHYAFS